MNNLRIWKFPVIGTDRFTHSMPKGAKVLSVQNQRGRPHMWVVVDPDAPLQLRYFRLAGTGHVLGVDQAGYIGTFQVSEGNLVFHLFEVPEADAIEESP